MLRQLNLLIVLLVALAVGGGVAWLIYDDQRTESLIIAAGARASEGFQLVEAIAAVVNVHHPRIRLEVIETGGSLDNSRLLDDGYADLALLQADAIGSRHARLMANLYPDAYQLIVRRNSGIESVADLAGKTVALPSRGSAQLTSFWYLANHYGLSEGDLNGLSMSNRSAEWAIISNAVDAAFRVRAPGDASVKQLVERADIALVPIEQAPALHLRKASINPGRIPKGSYRGHPPLPASDLVTASVDRLLVAADTVSENTVYTITEVLFERRRELSELSSLASLISSPDTGSGTTLPMHPGAIRYYDRDQPTFVSQQADFLRTMLSLVVLFASIFFGFRNWFQGVQKDRADAYNKDLLAIYERAQSGELPPEGYRDALAEILVRVINDLDSDRISRNGFDEFSFTWQAVSRLLERPATPSREAET